MGDGVSKLDAVRVLPAWPRVTAIVPNYNHARYLCARMDSVLGQTYPHLDVILLDDASTDGSQGVLAGFVQHARVRQAIFNEKNSGSPFHQWNLGVQRAQSELIWMAESDDACHPMMIERLAQSFMQNSRMALAYAHSLMVHDKGMADGLRDGFYRELHPTRWQHDFACAGETELAAYLWQKNTIPNASAVLFRQDLFWQCGGADESMRLCGDWLLWAKLLQRGDIAFCAQPLNYFRVHERSARRLQRRRKLIETIEPILHIIEHVPLPPATRKRAFKRLARYWLGLLLTGHVSFAAHQQALMRVRSIEPDIDRMLARSLGATFRWGGEYLWNRVAGRKASL